MAKNTAEIALEIAKAKHKRDKPGCVTTASPLRPLPIAYDGFGFECRTCLEQITVTGMEAAAIRRVRHT